MFLNIILVLLTFLVLIILFHPRLRKSDYWRATVTPLASIIGSGFLVVAPLLAYAVGTWAPLAMIGILALAFSLGAVMRFNITYLEPQLANNYPLSRGIERLSNLALTVAYMVSVAFYVRLLASFLLHPLGETEFWVANIITTLILAIIGIVGYFRGLFGLEWLEESAVNIKLSIIIALLGGLFWFNVDWLSGSATLTLEPISDKWHALRLLAGMLLIVQGFETSRYLQASYKAHLRKKTMRHAQWYAAIIYLIFVVLALPLLGPINHVPSETAIIDMSSQVASVLPILLIIAAVMSQLSAAVADTASAGGMFTEASNEKLSLNISYLLAIITAIVLVWSVNIFNIIMLASKAFALYYLIQCLAAFLAARAIKHSLIRHLLRIAFLVLAIILTLVVIFAIPIESV